MAISTKLYLLLLIGLCCASVALSASMNYDDILEATSDNLSAGNSSEVEDDDMSSGSGDGEMTDAKEDMANEEEEGSGNEKAEDKEDMSEDEEDMPKDEEDMSADEEKMPKDEMSAKKTDEGSSTEDAEENLEEDDDSCPEPSSKDCNISGTLKSLVQYIKVLSEEMEELRKKVGESCSAKFTEEDESSGDGEDGSGDEEGSGDDAESTDEEEGSSEGSGEEDEKSQEDMTEEMEKEEETDEDEKDKTSTEDEESLPPPPESCPPPFQLLASSCYYIQTDHREWRSWGDANAFCQEQDGHLAAPYRPKELIDYLLQSYSGGIWVGGQVTNGKFEWLNGRDIGAEEWKEGHPSDHPTRECVLLDSRHGYRAVNYYCGVKFSFVCEHDGSPSQPQ